ncbi:MAG TPA: hypothetical protein PKX05_01060 [bacterium]|nr:hypothetical protein [bacterium]
MKKICALFCIIGFFFTFCVSCSKKTQQQPQPQSSGNPIEEYGGVMSQTLKKAKGMDAVLPVKQLVDSFYAQEGRYPSSLDELIAKNYVKQIPPPPKGYTYTYTPSTGDVGLEQTSQ